MDKLHFEERREKLRRLMRKEDLDALLVTLDANRYYLSGFELHDAQVNESSGCLIVRKDGRDTLCTDARFHDAAKRLWDEERIFIHKGAAMKQINALLKDGGFSRIGFEARNISLEQFENVSEGLPMHRADGMVESLRMIKEPAEIERLRESCALNHKLMAWLPGVLVPGRSEAQAAWDIEQFFRNNGAEELAFSCIVGVNGNAALPHAEPGPDQIGEECKVLVDVGCRVRRYCSDQTRCYHIGRPDPLYERDLELIRAAQSRAIALMAPGVPAAEVYAAARSFLDEAGVGHLFTHGLGHGIGLQTHEGPSLNPASGATLLEGMVITVEPGLYRPGRSGARWEYMVLVTGDGAEVF